MKVFCVITERDGKTVKAPGVSTTEVCRETTRFAADSLREVWERAIEIETEECFVVAIYEEHPAITVLRKDESE